MFKRVRGLSCGDGVFRVPSEGGRRGRGFVVFWRGLQKGAEHLPQSCPSVKAFLLHSWLSSWYGTAVVADRVEQNCKTMTLCWKLGKSSMMCGQFQVAFVLKAAEALPFPTWVP